MSHGKRQVCRRCVLFNCKQVRRICSRAYSTSISIIGIEFKTDSYLLMPSVNLRQRNIGNMHRLNCGFRRLQSKHSTNLIKIRSFDPLKCIATLCSDVLERIKGSDFNQTEHSTSHCNVQRPFGNPRLIPWPTSRLGCTIILDLCLRSTFCDAVVLFTVWRNLRLLK